MTVTGSNVGATPESWETYTLDGVSPQSIWYYTVSTIDGDMKVTLAGSRFDTGLFVFELPSSGSSTLLSLVRSNFHEV